MDHQNILLGYGLKIRALRDEDVQYVQAHGGWPTMSDSTTCVAVDGVDLGACLAAVVDLEHNTLIWSDTAERVSEITPIPETRSYLVAQAVLNLIRELLPYSGVAEALSIYRQGGGLTWTR